jgi:4a-hydroxytetrahydrobiopterin dehydratase
MALLSVGEIEQALPLIGGWRLAGSALAKDYRFPGFKEAMIFVNKVATAAETANHHPDIDIRYNEVHLTLTSHDAGGITQRDVDLARAINEI